jgi:hypothetical protein
MIHFRRWLSRHLAVIVLATFGGILVLQLTAILLTSAIEELDRDTFTLLLYPVLANALLGAVYVWLLHLIVVKRWKRYSRKHLRFQRRVVLPVPFEETFDRCLAARRAVGLCVLERSDPDVGNIRVTVPLNFWTCGEVIWLKVRPVDRDQTVVEVSSRCVAPVARLDWGKNRANVERIIQALEQTAA